jgi:hypothetical protein
MVGYVYNPSIQKAEAGEEDHELDASLSYIARLCLKKKNSRHGGSCL